MLVRKLVDLNGPEALRSALQDDGGRRREGQCPWPRRRQPGRTLSGLPTRGGRYFIYRPPGARYTVGSETCGRIRSHGRRAAASRGPACGYISSAQSTTEAQKSSDVTARPRGGGGGGGAVPAPGSEPAVPKRSNTVLWRCSKGRGRRAWRGSVHLAGAAAFTRQDNPGGLRRRGGKQRAIFSSAVEPLVTSRETTSATVDATVTELYFLIAARNAIFADRQLNCSTISESSEAPHRKLTTDFSKQHGKNSY